MNTKISAQRLEIRLITTALVIAGLPLFAALASAQAASADSYIDPAEIDRAVEQFTGFGIGEAGGARLPADRRLKLAACETPLGIKWHGRAQTIVRVDCPISRDSAEGWRVFIATSSIKPASEITKVVARGDPITVLVRGRGFTVQQSAEAMEAGAIGDWIAVRTQARADAISARIERPGLAVIPVG
ncbi:MAG: flagella basal body P-ring formation protein FlgA [Erythrobacter sp.]|uniref:flagella basal body P-ring formation protein FlgA n=1 Tax=Erythrobacter sp. TaxID=1042 RepID=UPI003263773C